MGAGDSKDATPVEYDASGYAKVGSSADFPASKLKKFKVGGHSVVICQAKDNTFYAMENKCSHFGGDLSAGEIVDIEGTQCVKCPRHGYTYDIKTGKYFDGKKEKSTCQTKYEVKQENGFFWVKPPADMKK